jgi:hypothetical protein
METTVFRISPYVTVENFVDSALVLRVNDRKLIELTPFGRDVLLYTDGIRSVLDVATICSIKKQISVEQTLCDVIEQYDLLKGQRIVEKMEIFQGKDGKLMTQTSDSSLYLHNPDVVLREEDEDGGLLYNPDTNQVKIVNSTGLFIWKQFESVQTVSTVVQSLCQVFEDVPQSDVLADVDAFIVEMVQSGFIGIVESV